MNNNMPAKGWSASGGKKILYLITQSELGGAQRYCLDLAVNLKNDFDISFAFGEQGEKGGLAKELKKNGISYYIMLHLKRAISPFNDFLAIFEIVKIIKKLKPDIIHLNSSKISILGSIAAKICYVLRVTCYVVYTAHGWVFNEPASAGKKAFYKYAEKFTVRLKDKIICINKSDYDIALNILKIKENKLSLIYHGIRPINFLTKEKAREKLSLISKFQILPPSRDPAKAVANSRFLIGTIANLYKTKGLEYLVEAARLLKDWGADAKFFIIGEGEERKNLEDLIAQVNLKSRIFLTGKIDNAAELLKAFDIYICSSVKEGFPFSILEAMSAGLPIVSTNVGGIPEMIINNESGLLVNPKSPDELARKIKQLIDEKEKISLGQKAQRDLNEKFTLDKMLEMTKKIYLL